MDKEKAERIIKIVDWVRYIILAVFLTFLFATLSKAQATHDFGVWYSARMEKKISADWKQASARNCVLNIGVSILTDGN